MARLFGRAPHGERCRAALPYGHWKTTTFTAGLRIGGLAAPMILDGPMDGGAFRAYVREVLVPELERGDIVIMIIFRPIRSAASGRQSRRRARGCFIFRPTRQTSTFPAARGHHRPRHPPLAAAGRGEAPISKWRPAMRRVVSLFLPAWTTDRLRRTLGDAAPPAVAPLVPNACENIVAEDRGRPSKFRLERSIPPDSKTAPRPCERRT
jgi:hypothetical protein